MAGELPTPIDIQTGLPLPILPAELSKEGSFSLLDGDDYHHHFHPRRSDDLLNNGGRAVRVSRGQYVNKNLHWRYHLMFDGPELPTTIEDKFRTTVLACAGIVPPKAIDLSTYGEYKIVDLSKRQLKKISDPASICIEGTHRSLARRDMIREELGRFFADFAVSRSVEVVKQELLIEEFLSKKIKPERRMHLGNKILSITLNESLWDIEQKRINLYKNGYEVGRKRLHEVVFGMFLPNKYQGQLYSKLKPVYVD